MELGVTTKGRFRFTKKERITHPQDFRRVMKFGRKYKSKNFILFMEKREDPFHRLGIVVKKDVGPATFRNRIRRYIREFFRLHKYEIKGSFNIILLVRKGCSAGRYRDTEGELKRLFVL
jgi:ribonuclease P protein component